MPIRRETWWEKRTSLERTLIRCYIIFLVIVFITLIVLLCSKFKHYTGVSELCLTAGCVRSATDLFNNINSTADPCDNFYNFACGNYVANSRIPQDKTFVNTFTLITNVLRRQLRHTLEEAPKDNESIAVQSAKLYYRACMNKTLVEKNSMDTLKDLIIELGGWPVLEGDYWTGNQFTWDNTIHSFRRFGLEFDSIIDLSVGFDLKNSSRRMVQIDQPTLGVSREFLIEGLNNKITLAYFNYMVDVAGLLGAKPTLAVRKELYQALQFEINLANNSLSQEERRNIFNLYNPMTVAQMQQRFPHIQWLDYINKILNGAEKVAENDVILVGVPKYINGLQELLRTAPKRVQANYLFWRAILSLIPYLNDDVRDLQLKFKRIYSGLEEIPPRWSDCVDEVEKSLPVITSALYVRKYFSSESKQHASDLVKEIKNEFKNLLKRIDWMDEQTRQRAVDKADGISDHIGYPDELLDDDVLGETFKELRVNESDYLRSMLNINRFGANYSFAKLRQPVNKSDWFEHSMSVQVNAFYHPVENSIILPAGILQGLFFNKDRPNYMNYGAIGSVIGHEITHGFDDTGRLFDKEGNLKEWWQMETRKAFLEKATCLINQYANFTVEEVNLKLNGIKTQGENIADNAGVKEAYLAYQSWVVKNGEERKLPGLPYSPNQLFWISAAQNWCGRYRRQAIEIIVTTDVHSPEEFRVMGPFSNSEYFSKDFNCPAGSRMNPVHKCTVW